MASEVHDLGVFLEKVVHSHVPTSPQNLNFLPCLCHDLHITLSNTFPPVVNGSTKLRKVNIAKVGREEGHQFQYLPGESNDTVWPGKYELRNMFQRK